MVKIAVLASFNMDLVMRTERLPDAGETLQGQFATFLGGKGFNQAVAARRLGADVVAVGRVGDDAYGAAFLAKLDAEGIDRRGVAVDPETGTGVAMVMVDEHGENAIIQAPHANRALTAADVERASAALSGASVALFQLETSDDACLAFASAAHREGARGIFNPAPPAAVADTLLGAADIVVPNEIEAAALTGMTTSSIEAAFQAAGRLRERCGADIVLTLGANGALISSSDGQLHVPAFAVNAVDTVGAGDAFCAALAVRLAEGADLADAVRFANAAGALACTGAGAEPSMPRREDVEALLANGVTR